MRSVAIRTTANVVVVCASLIAKTGDADSPAPITVQPDLGERSVSIDIALASTRKELKQRVEQAAGPLVTSHVPCSSFSWGNFRFRNPHLSVSSVTLAPSSSAREILVRVAGQIWMKREKFRSRWRGFHSGVRWMPDGSKPVATVKATMQARISSTAKSIVVDVVGQSVDVQAELRPVRGKSWHISLGNRSLYHYIRSVASDLPPGVEIAGLSIEHVSAEQIRVRVQLAIATDSSSLVGPPKKPCGIIPGRRSFTQGDPQRNRR